MMNQIQISKIQSSTQIPLGNARLNFHILTVCYLMALATQGFGDLDLYITKANIATYFVYLAFLFQVLSGTLKQPRILFFIFLYIILQSYVLNYSSISVVSSLRHFLIFILVSLSVFSYVSNYRMWILDMVKIYYRFCLGMISFSFFQLFLFLLFGVSFKPQYVFSGNMFSVPFSPEVLFLPRSIGLMTEPAHYSLLLLPAVYIALLALADIKNEFNLGGRGRAIIVLLGFVLSFSLVGYAGLLLCLLAVFGSQVRLNFGMKLILILGFGGMIYLVATSSLFSKINAIPIMFSQGVESYEFTSNDLSAFALVSNGLIAGKSLQNSYYLGSGFNSHKDTYDKEIYRLFNESQVLMQLNREGGGALLIRIASEFGIPGLLLFFICLSRLWTRKNKKNYVLAQLNHMGVVIVIAYSLRNGSYVDIYFLLFLAIAYYTQRIIKSDKQIPVYHLVES